MQRTDENTLDQNPESLRAEWEAVYGHPLTESEFQEVVDNVSAFFRLLHEWDVADRRKASEDAGQDGDLKGGRRK
jgi:hypothetical protein